MLKVLILDDDALFARTLAHNLRLNELTPYDVAYVTTAEEAYIAAQNTHPPFEVFLLDQRLGEGPDGIEVLRTLLDLSPESEAIVFTRAGDTEAGLRAYRARAYRYLHKPLDIAELEIVLASLKSWRDTKRERDGLRLLAKISEVAQELLPISEVGQRLVDACRDLGFERARLWLLEQDSQTLKGLSQSGNTGLTDFPNMYMKVADSKYAQHTLNAKLPQVFRGSQYGKSLLEQRFGNQGYQPPTGSWIGIPLWTRERCLGMLMLDNHTRPFSLPDEPPPLLHTLGNMVAAALDRAGLFEQEQRRRKELEVLDEIGRRASNHAVHVHLDELLKDVHEALGRLMDVDTFLIALYDEIHEVIDLRLDTEQGKPLESRKIGSMPGLLGHLLRGNQPLFLPDRASIHDFYKQFKIRKHRRGAPAKCWLGVPLTLEGRAVGAIVVQSISHEYVYTEEDQRVLIAVADQITGAIQNARLREATERNAKRLAVLQQAGGELLRLAEVSDEWLWHALLTLATADYALGFNRAMLFLLENGGMILRGRMGIGQFNGSEARGKWQKDKKGNLNFTSYLHKLREEHLWPTPVDEAVRHFKISLRYHQSAFSKVIRERRRAKIPVTAIGQLPVPFVQIFGRTNYAVVPLRIGEQCLGVVVVDNIHNHEPLDDVALDQLETVLTQVVLIYENLRQRRGNTQLINVSKTVLDQVANRPIQQTLLEICEVVQTITRADSVVIYPLLNLPGATLPRFDMKNAAAVGLSSDLSKNHPTLGGFTKQILTSGKLLVMPDILQSEWRASKDTSFVKREDVRAFIAVPIRDSSSSEMIGMLFLNYSEPQRFERNDIAGSEGFAELAGAAIRTARAEEQMRQNLGESEFHRQARERELAVLHDILTLALRPQVSRDKIIHALLLASYELLGISDVNIGLLLRRWKSPSESEEEPTEIRNQYHLDDNDQLLERPFGELKRGITGRSLFSGENYLIDDVTQPDWSGVFHEWPSNVKRVKMATRSEMDVLICPEGRQPIGLFNIESPVCGAFTADHLSLIRRLATVAALALDNVQRQTNLRNVLKAAETFVTAYDVEQTLQAVLEAGRRLAPGVSAITIWYQQPGQDYLQRGPFFGLRGEHPRSKLAMTDKQSAVVAVMRAGVPVWEESASDNFILRDSFIYEEDIESIAALPLIVEKQLVGVMFFNYRHKHHFTDEEYALFPIVATIAAASIRDALRVDNLSRANSRLKSVYNINEALGTSIDLNKTIISTLRVINDLFEDSQSCILTYNPEKDVLEFHPETLEFYQADFLDKAKNLQVQTSKSIACRIAQRALKNQPPLYEYTPDVLKDDSYMKVIDSTRSQASLALMSSESKLLGVLIVESKNAMLFDKLNEMTLISIGRSVSAAIERANSVEKKFIQIETDERRRYQEEVSMVRDFILNRTLWASELAHDVNSLIGQLNHYSGWIEDTLLSIDQSNMISSREDIYQSLMKIKDVLKVLSNTANVPRTFNNESRIFLDSWIKETMLPEINNLVAPYLHDVQLDLNCNGISVKASGTILARVFKHVLRNSINAMKRKGKIQIKTIRTDQFIEITISDTGPGISKIVAEKILKEPIFKQSENPSSDHGFGLLFARAMVEQMNGRIKIVETDGIGAAFAIYLHK